MKLVKEEDTELIELLKQGSQKALKQVYEDNRSKFISFAKRYNLPEEDVIDIYQDAFIVLHNNLVNGKLQTLTSSIATYLFGIGKRLIYERMRTNKKNVSFEDQMEVLPEQAAEVINFDSIDNELNEEQQLMKIHFDTLGEKCREILTLFYYRGFSIQDILNNTNYTSENVIKSTKSRCMKSLKERISANSI